MTTNFKYTAKNYLATAYSIGRKLAKDAIWSSDGRCNWQGDNLEIINNKYQIASITLGNGVYQGLSGIALFLSELSSRIPDTIIQEVFEGTMKNIISQEAIVSAANLSFSFFKGKIGVGYTLWRIGHLHQNDTWTQQGLRIIKTLVNQDLKPSQLDVIEGVAGAIPILLRVYAVEKEQYLLDLAIKCGDVLVKQASITNNMASWESLDDQRHLTGYSHGTAGISSALFDLYASTQNQIYLDMALKGLAFENSLFLPSINNWRDEKLTTEDKETLNCRTVWCYGAPGIALSRLKAYQVTRNVSFLEEATTALDTTLQWMQETLNSNINKNYSLCHGVSGNAEILLIGGKVLNEPKYISGAHLAANIGIEQYEKTGLNWLSGVLSLEKDYNEKTYSPGLMLGNAGIGYFYLRLVFPDAIESILML